MSGRVILNSRIGSAVGLEEKQNCNGPSCRKQNYAGILAEAMVHQFLKAGEAEIPCLGFDL